MKAIDTAMLNDYFTVDGLEKKTGISRYDWDTVILKELIDNALDAVEPLQDKQLSVSYSDKDGLTISDNGTGIPQKSISESIYNFQVYHSSKRYYITPSRGKQGNGLKTVICICKLNGYGLYWHTAEGNTVQYVIDATDSDIGNIRIQEHAVGTSEARGVTVKGIRLSQRYTAEIIREYSKCNPDVTINFAWNGTITAYKPITEPVNRSGSTNICFYDLDRWKTFLKNQDVSKTYKAILNETFGTAISNKSKIKGKLSGIDIHGQAVRDDFFNLQLSQNKKKYTILKSNMIGLENHFLMEDIDTHIPYIVEFTVDYLEEKQHELKCWCYVNNSITYEDGRSIQFKYGEHKLGTRKTEKTYDLYGLLSPYMDYSFEIHFISPQLAFLNTGKTEFDISGIIDELCKNLSKEMARKRKRHEEESEKPVKKRELMRMYLSEAYRLASSGGKYAITARQIFYKLRELSGLEETANTYSDFTQNILTEWLEENPEAEEKVYFAERGNFYIGSDQNGLGTGAVRSVINSDGNAQNNFITYGGLSDAVYLKPDFDLRYQYDKVLYIEKTGFDAILKAERVGEKYHTIIVSGQGFGTRAAKMLLYHFQKQGMKIYCLHDLDYHGVDIINSLREPNEKFTEEIIIEDMGITLADVHRYGIKPERIPITATDYKKIDKTRFTAEQRQFFFPDETAVQRVELNAFSTDQILAIISEKLGTVHNLPSMQLSDVMTLDTRKIKEAAVMRVLRKKFGYLVDTLPDPDITGSDKALTIYEIQEQAQDLINGILSDMEQAAEEKLNKIF